jgi:hypothetical protein
MVKSYIEGAFEPVKRGSIHSSYDNSKSFFLDSNHINVDKALPKISNLKIKKDVSGQNFSSNFSVKDLGSTINEKMMFKAKDPFLQ